MTRSVAINVAANTSLPGFRGPIYPDGRFVYVPIPEREPTADPVPTYGDLGAKLDFAIPVEHHDTPVHLDPEFAGYPHCARYSYGDEHAVKAGPLSKLRAGDYCFFYATLSNHGTAARPDWQAPEWGAYVIGHFRLAVDPVTGDQYCDLPADERARYANNAHVKRERFDAEVLLSGDDESALYDRAVPLSARENGGTANRLVTTLSSDSGKGPWWRRPMRFDADATAELLDVVRERDLDRCFS